ncbi:probable WRKY transcription factor 20 isoform X2 [Andrographis paniculata]|uniref:probable WRKY transcription factor 20 isoform X2 n=1 Tax=Andrographis paniculata TaxID=175694 RepID=UPI0021E75C62|nr:probable WRKY transcription factor 20 isoform X2 [Andrographis paniculata]
MSPVKLRISRSTCMTGASGFSPTSFLESTFPLSSFKNPRDTSEPCVDRSCSGDIIADDKASSSSFEFKLSPGSSGSRLLSQTILAGLNLDGPVNQVQGQNISQLSVPTSISLSDKQRSSEELNTSTATDMPESVCGKVEELAQDGWSNSSNATQSSDQKYSISLTAATKRTDEGYNWRKYGQKVVKGSEFPRSYYKCTYPNCEVRKIFEQSPSGQITEIVYKGSHDHPKPQPARHHNPGSLMSMHDKAMDRTVSEFTSQDDNLNTNIMEQNFSPRKSPCQGSKGFTGPESQIQGMNDDDQFSKLRKIEDGLDYTPVVKPIREPRVIVQTMTEVDILDDGYRWRKYGQKVVRGNPNPRSYYKCTVAGCTVRKHVERASHDPKSVLTTYEGKHNHDLPTSRPTSHEFSAAAFYGRPSNAMVEGSSSSSAFGLHLGVGNPFCQHSS